MARMRMIKPGFFLNEQLADLSPWARLLFAGLWCIADREGRLEDRPRKIKAEVFPYDDVRVDELLAALQSAGFVLRYSADGHDYIQVVNFTKHQSPHSREVPSVIPAPTKVVPEHDPGSDKTSPRLSLYSNFIQNTDTDTESMPQPANGVAKTPQQKATVKPSRPLSSKQKPPEPIPRPRNELWDAVVQAIGYEPKTRSECSNWGKVLQELKEAGATPEDVPIRCARYVRRWGKQYLTINALKTHWSELAVDVPVKTSTQNGGADDGEARQALAAELAAKANARKLTEQQHYEQAVQLANSETPVAWNGTSGKTSS